MNFTVINFCHFLINFFNNNEINPPVNYYMQNLIITEDACREISRLISEDSFLIEQRVKDDFEFPIHFHPKYELNYIYGGKGVRRIVGDHGDEIDDLELVLYHGGYWRVN